ncbi:hypothetical protein AB0F91_42995 [Amycolatopsis sp. NPDC023774]|uniref:hypothetical protein n=1 Tax=Amycolatopsis sp. NPDC023774 TaxID=3155015 RepID=UPI0033CFB295
MDVAPSKRVASLYDAVRSEVIITNPATAELIGHATAHHDLQTGRVVSDEDSTGMTYLEFLSEALGIFEALSTPGDYVLFGPAQAHRWHALGAATMLTVRWPSARPGHARDSGQRGLK